MNYIKQNSPTRIPVPGDKIIEEHFGMASNKISDFSVAHMHAPAGWGEPFQTPDFDEVTIMIKGKMQIDADGDVIILNAGETFLAPKGMKVRYSNPFDEDSEYWALCVPAFAPDKANRDS